MAEPVLSPDGKWMWTGTEWVPLPPSSSPFSSGLNLTDSVVAGDASHSQSNSSVVINLTTPETHPQKQIGQNGLGAISLNISDNFLLNLKYSGLSFLWFIACIIIFIFSPLTEMLSLLVPSNIGIEPDLGWFETLDTVDLSVMQKTVYFFSLLPIVLNYYVLFPGFTLTMIYILSRGSEASQESKSWSIIGLICNLGLLFGFLGTASGVMWDGEVGIFTIMFWAGISVLKKTKSPNIPSVNEFNPLSEDQRQITNHSPSQKVIADNNNSSGWPIWVVLVIPLVLISLMAASFVYFMG